ncbi:hypothetical protein WY13_02512 [Clostridium ljungdahlii]|uniref:Uncharacterized protein n=1 Tax=Clostridium ljungdahlii TaxID=1538 RepID=A0A168N4W9_9CLOT|nr:hypothetical protein WY13_02512 [Clostridium ljungdahlii]
MRIIKTLKDIEILFVLEFLSGIAERIQSPINILTIRIQ